jgi:hypothetical protein
MKEHYSDNYKSVRALYGYYCTLVKGGRNDEVTLLKLLQASGRYEAAKQEYWATYAEIKAEEARQRALAKKSVRAAAAALKRMENESNAVPDPPAAPPAPPKRSRPPPPPATEKVVWTPTPLTWD